MDYRHYLKAIGAATLVVATLLNADAAPLTPQQALERLSGENLRFRVSGNAPLQLAYTESSDNEPRLYVFNKGDHGFIITSADDRFAAVLGYSDCGAFDPETASPQLLWWLSQYAEEESFHLANPIVTAVEDGRGSRERAPRTEIAQMLTTTWDQENPYNLYCPTQGQKRCVTGCVATAMAQVVKYHAYPQQGKGTHSYEWNGQTLTFDYGNTTFDYSQMLDSYGAGATEEQRSAVASLMYACGVGVNMSYTTNESGASDMYIPYALKDYFNYDSGIRLLKRNYFTDSEWEDLVYGELADNRPVIYGGQAPSGGHQFVCDGYRDGYFHINWGWSGHGDGYFLLSALDPGIQGVGGFQGGYNSDQAMVWGAKPSEGDGEVWYPIYATGYPTVSKVYTGNYAVAIDFINGGFYNYSPEEFTLNFYIRFVSETGEEFRADRPMELSFRSASGLNVSGYSGISVYTPTDLKEGRYKAYLEFQTPEGTWQDLLIPLTLPTYINLMVGADGTYTYTDGTPEEKTKIWVSEFAPATTVYSGVSTRFDITIENQGTADFSDILTVNVFEKGKTTDALASNTITWAVPAGQTQSGYVEFTYDLPAGEYDIIVFDQYGDVASDVFPLTVVAQSVEAESVSLDLTEATMTEGETLTLTAAVEPEDASDKTLTWTSSDEEVATVSEGVVTAIKAGNATVTVSTVNGKTASCEITVEAKVIEAEGVVLDLTEATMTEGETLTLTAKVDPEDATDKTLTWTSSDEEVATVSEGVVTAIKAGKATVTVSTVNGKTASCEITVEAKVIEADGVALDLTEATMTEGETLTLTAKIDPEDATDKTLTWTSSDEEVATVADGVVTAIKAGKATVTVSTVNGKTATCEITVEAKVIHVESIILDKTEIDAVVGSEVQLEATLMPEDATDKTILWSSSDENVATVTENGLVTILGEGIATITAASAENPDIKAECLVAGISWVAAIESGIATADVYTIDGLTVRKNAVSADISNLEKGTYIIKIGSLSYKIVR